jgi:membrane complex biogenesis BtpA family protein
MGGNVKLFGRSKPIFGVVHLLPLPGAPRYRTLDHARRRALADAEELLSGGLDGLVIENYGDAPFFRYRVPAETIAAMTAIACEVRKLGDFPLGINVLRSDGESAMAIAVATGAQFIRVNVLSGAMLTDQGLISGCAAEVQRQRTSLRAQVDVWADVLVKHAEPLRPVDVIDAARDLRERALADAVIITGPRTGRAADPGRLAALRKALPTTPLVVGSGITADNLDSFWSDADAYIVGSGFHRARRLDSPVEKTRVHALADARQRLARSSAV